MADSTPVIPKPTLQSPCPCGSGKTFAECCAPVIAGTIRPETAERLMRARFTAHVTHDSAFIHRTYLATVTQPFIPDEKEPDIGWTRLVIHPQPPSRDPDIAFVDLSAYYVDQGREFALHENAEFKRIGGDWIYTRPLREGPAPVKASQPKPGRNDPCPCGSGKKYKHCCLGKA
jgi:SEC-C motif-containing protein